MYKIVVQEDEQPDNMFTFHTNEIYITKGVQDLGMSNLEISDLIRDIRKREDEAGGEIDHFQVLKNEQGHKIWIISDCIRKTMQGPITVLLPEEY